MQVRAPAISDQDQLLLFDLETDKKESSAQDPAFSHNRAVPVHRWVPWIAGFSQQFVRAAIDANLDRKGLVLDPFAGVGTTLVESLLAGHNTVGFEINPYASLVCETKVNAHKVSASTVVTVADDLESFSERALREAYVPQSVPPAGFKTRADFYSPDVLRKVLIIQDFIETVGGRTLKNVLRVAFGSVMVAFSNYSYEPSLGRRASSGKQDIQDFPVVESVAKKLRQMAQDIRWFRKNMRTKETRSEVYNQSFFECREKLHAATVDLIITSPPYLNNYHYNRNTRPHLYWLGFAEKPSDLKRLEEENFGKYWQTVRDRDPIPLAFRFEELETCLDEIRKRNPGKGVYGGSGWANYAASYFNDCHRFAREMKYVLGRRKKALIVVGNSILQGVMIPTDKFLGRIAESVGLEIVDIHIPRSTRVGNSIIHSDVRVEKAGKSDTLYEAVVELRKP